MEVVTPRPPGEHQVTALPPTGEHFVLPAHKSAVLILAVASALLPLPATAEPAGPTTTDVTFASGDHTLHGTVIAPPDANGPAVVIVAGAGSTHRDDYRREAEAFARAGITALIYDKASGYSRATSTFGDLADDALAGVRLLRTRPGVDPSLVGLWGHSQGGWVVPLAASRSNDVAFLVTVAASGMDAARTQLWSNHAHLAHAGVNTRLIGPLGHNVSRMLDAAGLFGDTAYDPATTLTGVDQPLLGVFAQHDRSTAPGESLTTFRQSLDQGGNTHYTLRVVPNADHNMRRSTNGFDDGTADFAPGYVDLMTSWINDLADGPPHASADAPPDQPVHSEPVTPLAWHESPWLHTIGVILMLLAFLAYPVAAAVRRLRGRRNPSPVRWPARCLAVGGIATVLGTLTYLFSIVQSGATDVRSSVLGRPLPWLLLQLTAVGVLVATTLVIAGWRRQRPTPRLAVLTAGGVVFLPWAAYWGLLTV
jgi:dienelactone hydrolase